MTVAYNTEPQENQARLEQAMSVLPSVTRQALLEVLQHQEPAVINGVIGHLKTPGPIDDAIYAIEQEYPAVVKAVSAILSELNPEVTELGLAEARRPVGKGIVE